MYKKIIVVAPHPDDETLGCGGTLLRHIHDGDEVTWLIATEMKTELGFSQVQINQRQEQIQSVAKFYGFHRTLELKFPTTRLDTIPFGDLVQGISDIFQVAQPEVIYLPSRGDVHTDHRLLFDAVVSCTKWFRYPYVKRILAYETLSETDFGVNPDYNGFRPNVYINIEDFIAAKLKVLGFYAGEMGEFPFPRSAEAIAALAKLRGVSAGFKAAEAFMLIKEIL
ncbi:glcnac-pi de-n-acetylase [Lucifera butyrica]|uniref:Glcnac-pi de-n-acetylase n=1 Tax=Lucifera butyrica TaxID=1351585 RepID=A0A498R308_9FIRM|nr:PIG-L family deacetylase [Lucifera butyrica]VBB05535.1 glcnac-pi de-n-acetylase [Lucifera butyrica]